MFRSKKLENRTRRHKRIRIKVSGSKARPRLAVFRSLKHTHLQLIDDEAGRTLISASTLEVDKKIKGKQERAKAASELLAKRAGDAGIKSIIFDRGGFQYHGRVKAVAEACRAAGLKF